VDLHDCCEEYAENCVSCTLHESIRQDERVLIAEILTKRVAWQDQEFRNKIISLVTRGSSEEKRKIVQYSTIDIDSDSAYIWIEKEKIQPPIKTLTEVDCNIDVGSDNRVVGIEILKWPEEAGNEERSLS
jgi:uncharacterized protein YuzE